MLPFVLIRLLYYWTEVNSNSPHFDLCCRFVVALGKYSKLVVSTIIIGGKMVYIDHQCAKFLLIWPTCVHAKTPPYIGGCSEWQLVSRTLLCTSKACILGRNMVI